MEDRTYYTYCHREPISGEIVYIGKGKHGRAWDVTRARGQHKEHQEWMLNLSKEGYIPRDWVFIGSTQLTEKEAFKLEKEWLHLHGRTRFNKQGGERNHMSKLTDEQAKYIFLKCREGASHQELADQFKVSRSAVSMIASRKQWKTVTAGL